MKNIWTIMKKELSRVFTDKKMVLMVMVLPGLMIFALYSVMGSAFNKKDEQVIQPITVYLQSENESVASLINNKDFYEKYSIEKITIITTFDNDYGSKLKNNEIDLAIIFAGQENQITLYYNSSNDKSIIANNYCTALFKSTEKVVIGDEQYSLLAPTDLGNSDSAQTQAIALMLPFLIMTFLFQGAMALGPESIAGDKERGTIATLLATPTKRSEIALGKILSLSILTSISALSSFVGIILSIPKLLQLSNLDLAYQATDYIAVLAVLVSTVLVIIGMVSILSAFAKNVKEAGMIALPLMIISMLVGMTTFISPVPAQNPLSYAIPLYNSAQILLSIFTFDFNVLNFSIMIVSNLLLTGILIYVLTKIFNNEKIMFSK